MIRAGSGSTLVPLLVIFFGSVLGKKIAEPDGFVQQEHKDGEAITLSCGHTKTLVEGCIWERNSAAGWENVTQDKKRKINISNLWCNLTLTEVSSEDKSPWRCQLFTSQHTQVGYFSVGANKEDLDIRLPTNIRPVFYKIFLTPYFEPDFSIPGNVEIQIEVLEPTDSVTLHIQDMYINEYNVFLSSQDGSDLQIVSHEYDSDRQFYRIKIKQIMQPGIYTLMIEFYGNLNNELTGFYRSSYLDSEGNTRWLAATQFETTSARRAFPCFDEPAMKAVFQINLARTTNMTSISNMPIERSEPFYGDYVWDVYQESVKMSTYLVAFVVSDFVYRESEDVGNGVKFRIWTQKDLYEQTAYAAEVGPKILQFYEEYFNVPFPLPKQDMIALPDFGAGAMENWGLITYRESALLYQQGISSLRDREGVAWVIAHELAHQWFGDLVTMEWWTDLWLNEGFASYMEDIGTYHVQPELNIVDRFVIHSVQPAMSLDALESSHPISIPVNHPDEINEIFDTISYKKGASVIRMMANLLTVKTFNRGITNYLQGNAYSNADQDDLWEYLNVAGHEDNTLPADLNLKDIMDTWTLQMGYPVVNVERNYETQSVSFQQKRFLINPNSTSDGTYAWFVPLSWTEPHHPSASFNDTAVKSWLYPDSENVEILVEEALIDLPLIVNVQETGFYRVNYDPVNWKLIADLLVSDHKAIHETNRAQILDDAFNLARAGLISYTLALGETAYLKNEKDYIPWMSALNGFKYLESMMKRSPGYGDFRQYMISALQPLYDELTFEELGDDLGLDRFLREDVVNWMCRLDQQDCSVKSLLLFKQWMQSEDPDLGSPIPSFSRETVLCTALQQGSETEWDFLFSRFLNSNNGNEKSAIISALGCIKEDWILERYLDMALHETSGVKRQDGYMVVQAVSKNTLGRYIAWNWIRNNWNLIRELYDTGIISFTSSMIEGIAGDFNTASDLKELQQFATNNQDNLGTASMVVMQMIESTRVNVDWVEEHYDTIVDWLNPNNYKK